MSFRRHTAAKKYHYFSLLAGIVFAVLGVSSLSAQGASSIAQGFQTTDKNVVSGALVSVKNNTPNTVELSDTANLNQIAGIAGNNALIELSNGTTSVQVVTSGVTPTLVSDMNGVVKTGDRITASPIAGVGMRATANTLVIGTAVSNFSSTKTEARTITSKSGKRTTVHIGSIQLDVDKVYYQPPTDDTFIPASFQNFANNLVGHQVGPIRVLVATLLILFLFVTVAVLLYSSVRSSIISIGRNPLSESGVRKSLLSVGLTALGIMVFTMIVVYLVLSL